jgi:hypothetical protein
MGCACFKQDVVNKNIKITKANNNIDENKNININIRIAQNENLDNNIEVVRNPQVSNRLNNNVQSLGMTNERVIQNNHHRVLRNNNRGNENLNNLPNEPYLQSKQNPNFNMPEDGKSEFI